MLLLRLGEGLMVSAMKDSEISPPAHFKRCSCEKQVSAHAQNSLIRPPSSAFCAVL